MTAQVMDSLHCASYTYRFIQVTSPENQINESARAFVSHTSPTNYREEKNNGGGGGGRDCSNRGIQERETETERQRETETERHRERQRRRQKERERERLAETDSDRQRLSYRQTDRQVEKERDRQTETDRQTDGQTERDRDGERKRQSQRETMPVERGPVSLAEPFWVIDARFTQVCHLALSYTDEDGPLAEDGQTSLVHWNRLFAVCV